MRLDLRAKGSAAPVTPSEADIRAAMLGARTFVEVTIPRTNIRARMRICSRKEELEAKAAARHAMAEAGFPIDHQALTALGAHEQWLGEVMVQIIAVAVRDPDPKQDRALATLDDWRECDDMQLVELWNAYQDLLQQLDPVGAKVVLSTEDLASLTAAAKKKDADLLMLFGSRKLALFAISSACPPASSETPTSSSGGPPT